MPRNLNLYAPAAALLAWMRGYSLRIHEMPERASEPCVHLLYKEAAGAGPEGPAHG